MGVCLSCHRRKGQGRGSEKNKCDVRLCQSLTPLHERIPECGALPPAREHKTSSHPYSPYNGPSQRGCAPLSIVGSTAAPLCNSPGEPVDSFGKVYVRDLASNGKHSVVLSNGHSSNLCPSPSLAAPQTKDISCNSTCGTPQSDLINVKTCARDSMTMANMKKPNLIKALVSKKRRRFMNKDFNLDLTYIKDNIIAMGLPAEKLEKFYRNNIDDVAKFLEETHKDHYKIYNLCSEKSYDNNKFQNRVAEYPFDDHNPPRIDLITSFCKDVREWLRANPSNVAAVHCKAGKGRTGTMISCYLLHDGMCQTAEEALNFYGEKRTSDCKGVTIPSQRRYVEYYAAFLDMCRNLEYGSPVNPIELYRPPSMVILRLIMKPPPILNGGQATLEFFVTEVNRSTKLSLGTYEVKKGATSICMQMDRCMPLVGDIKVDVYNTKSKIKMRRERLFHFWFNTFFVAHQVYAVKEDTSEQSDTLLTNLKLTFAKWELDVAHKDKNNKMFSPDFTVQLIVQQVPKGSKWGNSEQRQRASPASQSHSSSAEEEDSEDSLEPEENWDSGGVVRGEAGVLGRYRLLSEPDLDVEGEGQPGDPSSPPAAGTRTHSHSCPCPDADAMLQA